jgi:TetR/AcrR family transcriptional regulator
MKNKSSATRPASRATDGAAGALRPRVRQAGPVPRRAVGSSLAPRPRRRPPKHSGGDARLSLLAAARELFARYGYRAVSARQIARRAAVDPSLLCYYFKGKNGLYREVLAEALAPVFAAVAALGGAPGADPPSADAATSVAAPREVAGEAAEVMARVVAAYMRVLAANPWIPGLIVREVLSGTGGYRNQFVRDFPGQIAPLAIAALQRAGAAGRLRPGLDPRLALISCIGMAVMPFIGAPVLEKVFGSDFLREPERLITHTLDMVRHALQGPDA